MLFKWKRNKKGQASPTSAGGAATLIVILGLIFVLYILFLPPEVREELLNPENESDDYTYSDEVKSLLLNKAPGKIDHVSLKTYEHNIPSFNLMKTTNSRIFAQENPFLVKRTWFSSKEKEIFFEVANLRETSEVKMSFNAPERKGRLSIMLNGAEIYNKELTNTMVEPITLGENIMQNNRLIFSVSSPDWRFWDSNYYSIENLIVAGDVSDSSNLEGVHTFFVEEQEKRNIDEARLIFTPVCQETTVGKLIIDLNGENIYSSIPDCGSPVRIDFSPSLLMPEENYINFKSGFGQYLLDTINVKTEVSESYYPTYYFDLSGSQMENIDDKDDQINITVEMLDDDEFKEAYVLINSKRAYIDTRDESWTKDIRNFVKEGTNTVQIKPMKSLEIIRLRIEIFD